MNLDDEVAPVQCSIQESAKLAARRRLLRGSVSVPAVLTLSAGSALAASSPIQCFNNAPVNASDSDRSQFPLQQYKGPPPSGNDTLYVVKADDILALTTATAGMIQTPAFTSGTWIQISTFTRVDVKTGQGNQPQPDGSFLVAPRFTLTGGTPALPVFTVTGLVPFGSSGGTGEANNGRIISKSCWTSFK